MGGIHTHSIYFFISEIERNDIRPHFSLYFYHNKTKLYIYITLYTLQYILYYIHFN